MRIKQVFGKYQSGQAILLIAVSAIGLIAMMGLAIDGGRLLLLRRDTQNAADAAAIAAARALCTGDDPVAAAEAAAFQNGFDDNEIDNWVDVFTPPEDIGITLDTDCEGCYIQVKIKGQIPPTFIGLVYDGDLAATSRAIGTCNPDLTGGSGGAPELRALWTMGPAGESACSNGQLSITTSDLTVEGGFHSNGTAKLNPSNDPVANTVCGASSVVVPDGTGDDVLNNENKIGWKPTCDGSTPVPDSYEFPGGTCTASCFTPADAPEIETIPTDGEPYVTDEKTEWPISTTIADYNNKNKVGSAAYEADQLGKYWVVGGDCSKFGSWLIDRHYTESTKTIDEGIYFGFCDIVIDNDKGLDGSYGKVTIVATGTIKTVNANNMTWEPYVNDILMFSNADTNCSNAIDFSGNNNTWNGILFAPYGTVEASGSNNTTGTGGGCILGWAVQFSGSNNTIKCKTDESTHEPIPGMWLSE